MTEQHEAMVRLTGEPTEIERLAHWFRGDLTHEGGGTTQMRVTAESLEWLAGMIAMLSTSFAVEVLDAPDEVRSRLHDAVQNLSLASGRVS